MPTGVSRDRLDAAYVAARQALLGELTPAGHWVGELSTSALSTATAVMALEMVRRQGRDAVAGRRLPDLIHNGLDWLAHHQNDDGGWGDTIRSFSNISTTMLCRAAFVAADRSTSRDDVVRAAGESIDRAGGVPALIARYGRDKTFSVPILTHCALAGLAEWRDVAALPFELACLPPRFYRTVRLPVVSYALPALIAIGQVRHYHCPTRNPVTRFLRALARGRSLRVLERIQPRPGGFLEATPLTSFVTMSLAAMDLCAHPVVTRGAEFIVNSVRDDGSWPIDTNLSTWVTTLAVNALEDDVPDDRREPLLRWLLNQQYRVVHPYTNADPGGWAWTDLPGGVPDADDTPGALLAIFTLSGPERTPELRQSIELAVRWLLGLQNRDGGWPTFCRGWGTLPFDRSSPDITAHVVRALSCWLDRTGDESTGQQPDRLSRRARRAVERGLRFLNRAQQSTGAWLPLWFGNQHLGNEENPTYGTARVLAAYRDVGRLADDVAQHGINWLRQNQNPDGGWGGGARTPSSVEETALAVECLLEDPASHREAGRGLTWLLERIEDGSWRTPAPIGFYFARLWYFERLYPLVFTVRALRQASRRLHRDKD